MGCLRVRLRESGPVTQATLHQQPRQRAGPGTCHCELEPQRLELLGVQQRRSNFAVRPQAADRDAAIAALVAAASGTPPAARISMAVMDIEGYNG